MYMPIHLALRIPVERLLLNEWPIEPYVRYRTYLIDMMRFAIKATHTLTMLTAGHVEPESSTIQGSSNCWSGGRHTSCTKVIRNQVQLGAGVCKIVELINKILDLFSRIHPQGTYNCVLY